jgi:nitronate monooxygenase
MLLGTRWSSAFGLSTPMLNAPMGGVAGGRLATAVTRAGGLGMIGVGSAGSVDTLLREAALPRAVGARFGVGLLAWAVARDPALLDAAISLAPALICVSFGDVVPWVDRVHAAGILAATQVGTVAEARRAAAMGIDLIVARGAEGGGHGLGAVATLPLLQGVLDEVATPVLAAGGIGNSRGVAAVLAAGAAGVWLGTAFLACPESLLPAAAKRRVLAATATDTTYTGVFDTALGYPWPARYGERVLANAFTAEWTGREAELAGRPDVHDRLRRARDGQDYELAEIDAGQGVGLLHQPRPAGEIVRELTTGAAALLKASAVSPVCCGPVSEPEQS